MICQKGDGSLDLGLRHPGVGGYVDDAPGHILANRAGTCSVASKLPAFQIGVDGRQKPVAEVDSFPARGSKPAATVKWYEGPTQPKAPEGYDYKIGRGGGLIMVGTKGGICHDGMRPGSPRLYPQANWNDYKSKENEAKRVPKTLPRVKEGIQGDWMKAMREGKKSCSDFSYSAPLAEVIVLGTLAIRTGKALDWDAKTQTIKNNDAAKALFKIPARKGWNPEDLI